MSNLIFENNIAGRLGVDVSNINVYQDLANSKLIVRLEIDSLDFSSLSRYFQNVYPAVRSINIDPGINIYAAPGVQIRQHPSIQRTRGAQEHYDMQQRQQAIYAYFDGPPQVQMNETSNIMIRPITDFDKVKSVVNPVEVKTPDQAKPERKKRTLPDV